MDNVPYPHPCSENCDALLQAHAASSDAFARLRANAMAARQQMAAARRILDQVERDEAALQEAFVGEYWAQFRPSDGNEPSLTTVADLERQSMATLCWAAVDRWGAFSAPLLCREPLNRMGKRTKRSEDNMRRSLIHALVSDAQRK
jgi:hypothetical protein